MVYDYFLSIHDIQSGGQSVGRYSAAYENAGEAVDIVVDCPADSSVSDGLDAGGSTHVVHVHDLEAQ